jgi:hypothetical protein
VTRQMATVVSQAIRDRGTGGYPRALPMTDALTPAQALEYLRTLSADILQAAVLGADGALLAGPPELAEPARALLAAAPEADDIEVSTAQASVFAARSDAHAVVLVCGRFALPALVRFDLRMVLGDLAGVRSDAA